MMSMPESSAITRLTLLPTAPRERDTATDAPKVRRYRLAAVRAPRAGQPSDRFAHLKRTYD
jgi:hypothetical protein